EAEAAQAPAAPPAAQASGRETIQRYLIVSGDSSTGWYDSRDSGQLGEWKARFGPNFVLFHRGGNIYIVSDHKVMDDLYDAMAPQREVNHLQSEVNRQQNEVNNHQSKVNGHQAEVNRAQQTVNEEQQEVNRRQRDGFSDNEGQSRVNAHQAVVNEKQHVVNGEQAVVNGEQQVVNREQEK